MKYFALLLFYLHSGAWFEFMSPKGIRDTMSCDIGIYFYVNNFPELVQLFKDTIYHNCRYLPKLPDDKVFYMSYNEPVIKNNFRLGDFDVPFYFVDVNFDGEKDLLIRSSIRFNDCKILSNWEIKANYRINEAIPVWFLICLIILVLTGKTKILLFTMDLQRVIIAILLMN